jgi:hypothetical protein
MTPLTTIMGPVVQDPTHTWYMLYYMPIPLTALLYSSANWCAKYPTTYNCIMPRSYTPPQELSFLTQYLESEGESRLVAERIKNATFWVLNFPNRPFPALSTCENVADLLLWKCHCHNNVSPHP